MTKVNSLFKMLLNSPAIRQSAVLTGGSFATGVLSAVALIYISRILGPEQFGIFSVGTAIMAITSRVGDLGLSTIITRLLPKLHNNHQKSKEFLAQISKWKLTMSAVGLTLLTLLIPFAGNLLNYPYPVLLGLALFGSLGLILYEYVLLVLSAFHEFKWVSILNIFQALLKVVSFITLGMLGIATATTVTVFYYSAPVVGSLIVAGFFARWFFIRPETASSEMRNEVKKHITHAAIGMVAMTLISNIDVLFVQKYLSTFEVGIYSAAMRIALFVTFLGSAVGGVLNNRVSRYQTNELLVSYLKKSLLVVLIAVVGFLTFLPFAKLILTMTLGQEFLPGLFPMIILVLNAFLSLAIIPYISFFYSVNHPKYFSMGGILQVLVICIGNFFFLSKYGLEAAAYTRVTATLAHILFTLLFVRYAIQRNRNNPGEN